MFSVFCPSVCCPLTPISRGAISLYLVEEFQYGTNIHHVNVLYKVKVTVKVKGQRS